MTVYDVVHNIVDNHNYDMETDNVNKIIAIAYYMGREDSCIETSNEYRKLLAKQKERARQCRYHKMALEVQGDIDYVYMPDYAGDMTKPLHMTKARFCLALSKQYKYMFQSVSPGLLGDPLSGSIHPVTTVK